MKHMLQLTESLKQRQKLWSATEYHRAIAAGVFSPDDKLELIEGYILQMAAKGRPHVITTSWLAGLLERQLPSGYFIQTQDPIRLNDRSEPEPDIAIVLGNLLDYIDAPPSPGDLILVIEVADTTLESDRQVKIPLYGKASIAEVWLVDINNCEITRYLSPTENGYEEVHVLNSKQQISPRLLPQVNLNIDEIFPIQ